jgi:ParB family transcriptional regulator, chromosome partitioning protein
MNATIDKRKALGRGLDSLLSPGPRAVVGGGANVATVVSPTREAGEGMAVPVVDGTSAVLAELRAQAAPRPIPLAGVTEIALDLIDENPYQTRGLFRERELHELAESIKTMGVMQPIVVRPAAGERYMLIVGERRCRASKMAGKEKIPAIVRQVSDQQAAEMTIIENLQRQDLSCIEQAHAFALLSQKFGMTQEQIGARTGCSRETISNYMRLLKLPELVRHMLQQGRLDFSQGRVLLNLLDMENAYKVAMIAIERELSIAQLEDLVFETNVPLQKTKEPGQGGARWVDPNVRAIQGDLERTLGVRVRISDRRGKGKIVIEYATLEDFDRVVEMLKGKSQ